MSAKPLVSIFTPCYNHEKYLDDYFRGLFAQTYRNLEIIILDDGSTDGSWEKIKSYEARLRQAFPSVICERHENAGLLKTSAAGIKRVTGEFFCQLESDDYYHPEKIEENVRYLQEHPDDGCVHSDYFEITPEGQHVRIYYKDHGIKVPSGWVYEELLIVPNVKLLTFCGRTELIKRYVDFEKYAARGYLRSDSPMWYDLSQQTRFGYINKPLAYSRLVEESISRSRKGKRIIAWLESSFQIKFDAMKEYGAPELIRQRILEEYHGLLFRRGVRYCEPSVCTKGYEWLVRERPAKYKTFRNWLRMNVVKNPFSRQLLKIRNKWIGLI